MKSIYSISSTWSVYCAIWIELVAGNVAQSQSAVVQTFQTDLCFSIPSHPNLLVIRKLWEIFASNTHRAICRIITALNPTPLNFKQIAPRMSPSAPWLQTTLEQRRGLQIALGWSTAVAVLPAVSWRDLTEPPTTDCTAPVPLNNSAGNSTMWMPVVWSS